MTFRGLGPEIAVRICQHTSTERFSGGKRLNASKLTSNDSFVEAVPMVKLINVILVRPTPRVLLWNINWR